MSIIRKEQLSNPLSASYALTASYVENANVTVNTSSLLVTASANINTVTFTKGDASQFSITVNTGSATIIDTSSLVTTSSFNAFTASINTFTSSYNTGSFSGSFTGSFNGTASWAESASQAISSSYTLSASFATTASYALTATTATSATQASDIVLTVLNQTGAQINKGTVVRVTGSNNSSDIPRIGIADWTNDNLSANTIGLVMSNIANGATGSVLTEGIFIGYDTDTPGWTSGQLVFLGANGTITGSAPQAPLHGVRLGQVIRVQQNNGSIYVRIDNGYELDELHDVKITSPTNGNLLVRSSSVWVNSNQLTGSYGLTGSLTATSFTGSLFGTSSWANNVFQAVSSSFSTTASHALNIPQLRITDDGVGLTVNAASIDFSGSGVTATANDNNITVIIPGGSGTPGGTNTTIQFNDDNAFSGSSNFTFNKNTNLVTIQKAGVQNLFPPVETSTTSSLIINGNTIITGSLTTTAANIYTEFFPQIETLPFNTSLEWDIGKSGSTALVGLTNDVTSFNISYFGQEVQYTKGTLIIRQNATGGWNFVLPTTNGGGSILNLVQDNGGGIYNPTKDPGAYDILEFICLNKVIFWSIKYNFT